MASYGAHGAHGPWHMAMAAMAMAAMARPPRPRPRLRAPQAASGRLRPQPQPQPGRWQAGRRPRRRRSIKSSVPSHHLRHRHLRCHLRTTPDSGPDSRLRTPDSNSSRTPAPDSGLLGLGLGLRIPDPDPDSRLKTQTDLDGNFGLRSDSGFGDNSKLKVSAAAAPMRSLVLLSAPKCKHAIWKAAPDRTAVFLTLQSLALQLQSLARTTMPFLLKCCLYKPAHLPKLKASKAPLLAKVCVKNFFAFPSLKMFFTFTCQLCTWSCGALRMSLADLSV